MPTRRLSASARRLGLFTTTTALLASCSSLLGIEDPVPRDCKGDDCDDAGGNGGVPANTGGKSPIVAGSANAEGGVGGDPTTPKVDAGEGGAIHHSSVGGMGGETGGAPPQIECGDTDVRCDTYQRQICVSGHWMDYGDECPLACVDGECQEPPSCSAEGAPTPCVGNVSCCETIWIPGGTYQMANGDEEDPEVSYSRAVSGFYLDRFEVTVQRFRAFQSKYAVPKPGDGAHPRIPGTGWQPAWEDVPHVSADGRKAVPSDSDELLTQVTDDCDASTWAENNPLLPINCVNWYVAFAFCAFDGGRLPTEAEWNFAASAGDAQLPYPWSESTTDVSIDGSKATFYDYPNAAFLLPIDVGSYPAGRARFSRFSGRGHDDLAGNVAEWVIDQWLEAPPTECAADCAAPWAENVDERVVRGGTYGSAYNELRAGSRMWATGSEIASYWGFRCARDIDTTSAE